MIKWIRVCIIDCVKVRSFVVKSQRSCLRSAWKVALKENYSSYLNKLIQLSIWFSNKNTYPKHSKEIRRCLFNKHWINLFMNFRICHSIFQICRIIQIELPNNRHSQPVWSIFGMVIYGGNAWIYWKLVSIQALGIKTSHIHFFSVFMLCWFRFL